MVEGRLQKSPSVDMNPEWRAMFGEEQRAMINVQPTNSSLSSVFLDGLSAGDVHEANNSTMVASTISNLVVDHSHTFAGWLHSITSFGSFFFDAVHFTFSSRRSDQNALRIR